jgi:hypothetical protein
VWRTKVERWARVDYGWETPATCRCGVVGGEAGRRGVGSQGAWSARLESTEWWFHKKILSQALRVSADAVVCL